MIYAKCGNTNISVVICLRIIETIFCLIKCYIPDNKHLRKKIANIRIYQSYVQ